MPTTTPTAPAVTLNATEKHYVIQSSGGFSVWGFENAFKESTALAKALGVREPAPEEFGTLALYERHRNELVPAFAKSPLSQQMWFNADTPQEVRAVLESASKKEQRVRLFYGDTKTGRSWMDENDMEGTIGRSTGTMKIPLLISDGERGGGGILDACIVRIEGANGRVLYSHPKFHTPDIEVRLKDGAPSEFPIEVLAEKDGAMTVIAGFKNGEDAKRFVSFVHRSPGKITDSLGILAGKVKFQSLNVPVLPASSAPAKGPRA